jgi:hypothetical protein
VLSFFDGNGARRDGLTTHLKKLVELLADALKKLEGLRVHSRL